MDVPGRGSASFACAFAVALAAGAPAVRAQDYPTRPVHMLVGFTAGSAADITARVLAPSMSASLGQQIVVELKPGAGSNLAAETVAHAEKDGYTLSMASSANVTSTAINPKVPLDMTRDLAPIALATGIPVVLVVNPASNVKSVQELIALAKSKPGGLLYGSPGVGTTSQMAGELFGMRIGAKFVHVPYQGSPQAVADLMAGRFDFMFSPASTVLPQIAAGKLRGLATAAAKRPSTVPDLPTLEESGVADFDTTIWFGLMAPAGTSPAIIARLAKAVQDGLHQPDVAKLLHAQGFEPLGGGPEEFTRQIVNESEKWKRVAQAAGITQ